MHNKGRKTLVTGMGTGTKDWRKWNVEERHQTGRTESLYQNTSIKTIIKWNIEYLNRERSTIEFGKTLEKKLSSFPSQNPVHIRRHLLAG